MWATILKAIAAIVGAIKPLLLPFAYWLGMRAGKKQRDLEQEAANAQLQEEYAEIAVQHVSDEELDDKLDKGTF
jgi:hypothetical protein